MYMGVSSYAPNSDNRTLIKTDFIHRNLTHFFDPNFVILYLKSNTSLVLECLRYTELSKPLSKILISTSKKP